MGHLKGAAQHCDFILLLEDTSYTKKMVMHSLVQGLEDAAITKDVMKESSTYVDLQTRINLEKIEKLVNAIANAKRDHKKN